MFAKSDLKGIVIFLTLSHKLCEANHFQPYLFPPFPQLFLAISDYAFIRNHFWTRSTRRAQKSLAKADHYSHIAQCKNVEPWWWKANPKGFRSLPAPRYGYATTVMVFFAHLRILEYPDHRQNLISSSLYYPGPLHIISSQSAHNFLSNVVWRQTDRQTDKPTLPKT